MASSREFAVLPNCSVILQFLRFWATPERYLCQRGCFTIPKSHKKNMHKMVVSFVRFLFFKLRVCRMADSKQSQLMDVIVYAGLPLVGGLYCSPYAYCGGLLVGAVQGIASSFIRMSWGAAVTLGLPTLLFGGAFLYGCMSIAKDEGTKGERWRYVSAYGLFLGVCYAAFVAGYCSGWAFVSPATL